MLITRCNKIENENIFKFSPYNCLTGEQNEVGTDIIMDIIDTFTNDKKGVSLVNGCAGTGKTVVADKYHKFSNEYIGY